MGARVIQLAEFKALRDAAEPRLATLDTTAERDERFHFWSGASGRRYVHTVYDLVDCPEIPAANFLLVHRDATGRRTVLALGHLKHNAASLNLAEIRHRGARLGANEVHIHLLGANAHDRRTIELDLRARIDDCTDERITATRH
ncbi:MAG: hypothetical protein AB7S70_05840 [Hyphomicrobium sp.]|uniref:hypothetical protein n=1 Tax=Hyphomicrobium sp. TaxID=82 RepID=UPI003D0F3CB2